MIASSESDIKRRSGLAWGAWDTMSKIWTAKYLPLKLKIEIFDASIVSILLYGCETWIINTSSENKLNTFANDCYRQILGINRIDKLPLATIYERVGRGQLITTIRRRQLGWLGHTLRRREDEPARQLALYEPNQRHGLGKKGAPPLSYTKDVIRSIYGDTKALKLTADDVIRTSQNRDESRRIIKEQDKQPRPKSIRTRKGP